MRGSCHINDEALQEYTKNMATTTKKSVTARKSYKEEPCEEKRRSKNDY